MNNPYSVQVSLVEGCNRLCDFCGIRSIRSRPMQDLKFMTQATLSAVVSGISSFENRPRVELAMHGEPTLHPTFLSFARQMRAGLPESQISLTTNGYSLFSGACGAIEYVLLDIFSSAGVDFIVLDTYGDLREQMKARLALAAARVGAKVIDFYRSDVSPWHNHRRKLNKTVFLMDDIGVRSGEKKSRTLFNHAGNSKVIPRANSPKVATCTIPFREVSVCWNGDVCTCCMDWKHDLVAGNVNASRLQDIWVGKVFTAARRALSVKNRSFTPCCYCDCGPGTRPGLLEKQFPVEDSELELLRAGGVK